MDRARNSRKVGRPGASSTCRLTPEESERLLDLIKQWMRRLGIRSGYELYLLGSVSRATIYRWLSGRIPLDGVRQLAEILSQYANHDGPSRDLEAVLEKRSAYVSALSPLVAEFRARRVPYHRAIEAINAAHFRIVPMEPIAKDNFGKELNESERPELAAEGTQRTEGAAGRL